MVFQVSEGMDVDGSSTAREFVDESACFSDESSFYGDDKTKSTYQAQSFAFDPNRFWESQQRSLQWIAEQNRQAADAKAARTRFHLNKSNCDPEMSRESNVTSSPTIHQEVVTDDEPMQIGAKPRQEPELFNPWEGDEMAKQLNEPLNDFLNRLKPSTTPVSTGPWIWIANPHAERQGKCDIPGLKQEGHRLLEIFASQRRTLEARYPDKQPGAITRMMRPAEDVLKEDIVKLARVKNLMNGKWMLFPTPSHVDEVWAKVARATTAGELGMGAKVATAGDDGRSERSRLICVYTYDFSDEEDVKRVLRKLKGMKLVGQQQGIFYKCDAYTYLDIMNGNEYKLKASMYGSKEMLKEG